MKIRVTRVFKPVEDTWIERCVECPYFGTDDSGPGPVMICEHPSFKKGTYDGAIISHPECDTGFPKKCPLINNRDKTILTPKQCAEQFEMYAKSNPNTESVHQLKFCADFLKEFCIDNES